MQSIILLTDQNEEVDNFIKKNFSNKDIIISVFPEKTEYSINQIRLIQKEVKYFNHKKRIYVFFNFHLSSSEAQNAFLKLLEEPPSNVIFILTTSNIYSLLPTIVSRTKIINLKKTNKNAENNFDKNIGKIIEKIKKGQLNLIKVNDKDSAKNITLSLINFFKTRLFIAADLKAYIILKELIKKFSLLNNNNLNPQLTVDNLLIFIYKCYNENKNG